MSAIFLSHSSADNEVAATIRDWLDGLGHRSVFLDFDPEGGIPAGRNWEQELYRQLRTCRAVLVLCSEASMASRWCFAEITHARSLGKHIFPVLVGPCDVDSILTDHQVVDLTGDRDAALGRLAAGLTAAGIDAEDPFDWDASRSPFPGLVAFEKQDAAIFFGRDEEIGAGLDTLNQVKWQGGAGLVMILGGSGSGKSSLLRAGLLPRLERDTERWIVVGPFRTGDDPFRELAAALATAYKANAREAEWREFETRLLAGRDAAATAANPLVELCEDLRLGGERREAAVLLVVDQFEELLGHPPGHPAEAFLAMSRAALAQRPSRLLMLGTMRSDFLPAFQKTPELRGMELKAVPVGPMGPANITEVIERPAKLAGVDLEPGLVQEIVSDTETEDALPLLAFTLRELYEGYGQDNVLSVQDYRQGLGGLQGAVAKAADGALAGGGLPDEPEALKRAFLAMVRINEDGRFARRPVHRDELPESVQPHLERFVQARLLVSRGDDEAAILEVAHEALFRAWDKLAGWLEESREALHLQKELGQGARLWEENGRPDDEYLWTKGRLLRAIELRDSGQLQLAPDELAFLEASEAAERRARERARRRRRRVLAAVAAVAVTTTILSVWAVSAQRRAERQRRATEIQGSRVLGVQARNYIAGRLDLALLLALEAHGVYESFESRTALLSALASRPRLDRFLHGHSGFVFGMAGRPDGLQLASSANDGAIRLWDPATGATEAVLRVDDVPLLGVSFSPDGGTLASGASDGTIRLWDLSRTPPEPLRVIDGDPGGRTSSVGFSDDLRHAALGAADGRVLVWDLDASRRLAESAGHDGREVWDVAFDPRGRFVASAGGDGTVEVRPLAGGGPRRFEGHAEGAYAVAFAPGGDRLATGAGDGTIRVWDLQGGAPREILGHRGRVRRLRFSDDGERLVSGAEDGTARVWEVASGRSLSELGGHESGAYSLALLGEERLATGSIDGTVRLWEIGRDVPGFEPEPGQGTLQGAALGDGGRRVIQSGLDGVVRVRDRDTGEVRSVLREHEGRQVWGLALSPDGRAAATASTDETARLWRWEEGSAVVTLPHGAWVWRVAVSPDGSTLATGDSNGRLRLFDLATGEPRDIELAGHEAWILSLEWSPDGRLLASGSDDHTVRLWDAATGRLVRTLEIESVEGLPAGASSLAIDADSRRLAAGGKDTHVRVWDLESGARTHLLPGHQGDVGAVGFGLGGSGIGSSDIGGSTLVSASQDATLRVWDLESGVALYGLTGHSGGIFDLGPGPEGSLLSAGADGSVRFWDVARLDRVRQDACRVANRNLTPDEWNDFIGEHLPYRPTCDLPGQPAPEARAANAAGADASSRPSPESQAAPAAATPETALSSPGLPGWERDSRTATCPAGEVCSISVACSAGKRILSGGVAGADERAVVRDSYPDGDASWRVRFEARGGPATLEVWVVCAGGAS